MVVKIAKDCDRIEATGTGEFSLDPKGYFLIRIEPESKSIEVGHCRKGNVIEKLFVGKRPEDIYEAIIKEGLVSRMEHAAYLGKELHKAYVALKLKLEYVQDDDLRFSP